jgi:hypothetical protein
VRLSKIIPILVALIVAALVLVFSFSPIGPLSPYRRFNNRDAAYYSRLTHACDSVLKQHNNFTRHTEAGHSPFLWMDANQVVWEQAKLAPSDPSVPDAIRTLKPDEILLAPGHVFMGFGVGRVGWAIIWEQDQTQTNQWILKSNGDGLEKIVYRERR